ncbi:hypothetical protein [Allokutzneria oryzae]|uniref:Type I-E CRISPR-associated protein Cse2/CasB n=1 Tax=Allokutzneria oryzae TaxID=1378989 RepID=A0ABV6A1G4_9PSEU
MLRTRYYDTEQVYACDMEWVEDLVSPDSVRRAAAVTRFHQAESDRRTSLMDALRNVWPTRIHSPDRVDGDPAELIHLTLRYLEWEALHPAEWHRDWGMKQKLLRRIVRCRADLDASHRERLAELVVMAVRREHRCKDQGYLRIVRLLGEDLRERLAAEPGDRARFLLYYLDHPELPVKTRAWNEWITGRAS